MTVTPSNQEFAITHQADPQGPGTAALPQARPEAFQRRKVFFLVDSFNVGGTESQAVELARRMDPAAYDLTVGCLKKEGPLLDRLQKSSIQVIEFYPQGGIDSIGGAREMLRLAAFLRRERFEVVHTHDLWSNLLGVPAARMVRVPVIVSSRRDLSQFAWYKTSRRVWLRRIQNLSNIVLANANSIREGLIAEDGFAPEKIRVIRNGVETETIQTTARDRERLFPGIGNSKLVVLVGNMHSDVKGHPWLIEAAQTVVREFPSTRFVLVGDGQDRKKCENQVANLGLRQNFLFLGRRKDVPEILACCDVAVLPSRAEGLPNAVLEYLASGLPTVATEIGGITEIIQDGNTGVLVPPENSDALARAVARLLRDPELSRKLGRSGREYVQRNFSFERLVREVDALYTELLESRGHSSRMNSTSRWSQRRNALAQRWKHRMTRLAAMNRDELLDRARQYLSARADGLRFRLGLDFPSEIHNGTTTKHPGFFFRPEQVLSLCGVLKQRMPNQVDQIVRQAERICRHHFDLLGYENIDYGNEIEWNCDQVHGKRAPGKPWFQVPYLNFQEVGDSKITWELNRHQHWVTLAKAYRLSGDERFANEIFRQWQHWHSANPYPIGINWASSLEVAFRSLSWLWVYFLLADAPVTPSGFRSEWLRALEINGRHIERYLSTYFSANTHLLGEGVALFFMGVLCPELAAAERWKQRGLEVVLREAEHQVQADGLHFEQSTYYHVYALDFFLHAAILASVNEIPLPKKFELKLEKMLDALLLLSRPGTPAQLGDDDGGRLFDPRRNRSEHMLDPLATGAVLFGRGDFKLVSGGLREETLWLLGSNGIDEFDRISEKVLDNNSVALPAGGIYLMTSAEAGYQLMVDAGHHGAITGGHGHADALSVCVNCKQGPLLIDPGTFEYVGSDSSRDQFRGTAAHNTLQIDGLNQAEPKGPFAWVRLPNVKRERWINGDHFDLFAGTQDGYAHLEHPVIHCRWIFGLKSRFWLVRDVAMGRGQHRLDLFWHLDPGLRQGRNGREIFHAENGGQGLGLLTAHGHDWSQEVSEGWWSPAYGRKEPAPVAHFGTVAELPTEFVTLLVPGVEKGEQELGKIVRIEGSSIAKVCGYRYRTSSEEEHCIVFGTAGEHWTLGPWRSDAEFMYWGVERDGLTRTLIFCNGTYVENSGRRIVSSKQRITRCELMGKGKETTVHSSEKESIVVHDSLEGIPSELEAVSLVSTLPDSKTGSQEMPSGRTGV